MPLIIIRHHKERAGFLIEGSITLGRLPENDVTLKARGISRAHARISLTDGKYLIEDLDSTNGTYVNEMRIHDPQLLQEGDEIRMGRVLLTYLEQSKLPVGLPHLRRNTSDTVVFRCGICAAVLKVPREKAGQKGRCQGCQSRIMITDPSAAPDYLQIS